MKRSSRLVIVVDMAKRARDLAAEELQYCVRSLAQEEQRLGELEQYYRDYKGNVKDCGSQLRAEDLSAKRNFLVKLSEACRVQQHQITQAEAKLIEARDGWRRCYLKHEKLQLFVQGLREEEIGFLEKMAQKQADDWVTQSYARKRTL